MGGFLKQSTAGVRTVLMTDSTDHISGKTGLTLVISASKNGAAFATITPTVTEIGSGLYALALTTAHTNTLGDLLLHITATGADPCDTHDQIVAFDPLDGAGLGLSRIDVTVGSRNAVAPDNATIGQIAGYIDTEVAAIKAKTDNLPASPAAVGSAMTLDLTQAVPTSNTAQTMGDALNAARAGAFGKWVLSGTSLTLYAANGTTVVRTFSLDSATTPTSRT